MNFVSNLFRKVVDKDQSTSKAQNTTVEIQKDLKTNLHIPPKLNRSYEGPDKENSLSHSNRTYDETIKTENITIKDKLNRSYTHELNRSFNEATNNSLDISEKSAYSLNSSFNTPNKSQTVKLTFDFTKNDFVEADTEDVISDNVSNDFHLNNTFETEKILEDKSISELSISGCLSENLKLDKEGNNQSLEEILKDLSDIVEDKKSVETHESEENIKPNMNKENIENHMVAHESNENIKTNEENTKTSERVKIDELLKAQENVTEVPKAQIENDVIAGGDENMVDLQMDIDEGIYFTQPKLPLYCEPMDYEEPMDIDEDLPVVNTNSCGLFDANLTMMNNTMLLPNSSVAQSIQDSQGLLERSSEYKKPRQSIVTNFDPLADTSINTSLSDSFLTQLSSHIPQEMVDSLSSIKSDKIMVDSLLSIKSEKIMEDSLEDLNEKTIIQNASLEGEECVSNVIDEKNFDSLENVREIIEENIEIEGIKNEALISQILNRSTEETVQNETIVINKTFEEDPEKNEEIFEECDDESSPNATMIVHKTFEEVDTQEKIQNETIIVNKTLEENDSQHTEMIQNETIIVNKTLEENDSQHPEMIQNETIIVNKTLEENDETHPEIIQNETIIVNKTLEENDEQHPEMIQNETIIVNKTLEENSQHPERIQDETIIVNKTLEGNYEQHPDMIQNETIIVNKTLEKNDSQNPEMIQNETIIINKSLEENDGQHPEMIQNETIIINKSLEENNEKAQNETIIISKIDEVPDKKQDIPESIINKVMEKPQQTPERPQNETIIIEQNSDSSPSSENLENNSIGLNTSFNECDQSPGLNETIVVSKNEQPIGNIQNETIILTKTSNSQNFESFELNKTLSCDNQGSVDKKPDQKRGMMTRMNEIDDDNFFKPASVDIFDHPIQNDPQFEPPRMSVLTKFDPLINTSTETPSEDSFLAQLTSYKSDTKLNKTDEFEKLEKLVMEENNDMFDSLEIGSKKIDTTIKPNDIKQTSSENKFINFDDIPIKVNKMENIINFDDVPIKSTKSQYEFEDEFCDKSEKVLKSEIKTDELTLSIQEVNNTVQSVEIEQNCVESIEIKTQEPTETPLNYDDIPIKKNSTNLYEEIPIKHEVESDELLESIKSEKDQIERFINISYIKQENLDETTDVIDTQEEIEMIQGESKTDDESSSKSSSFNDESPNKPKTHSTDVESDRILLKNTIESLNAELNLCHKRINQLETELAESNKTQEELNRILEENKRKESCGRNQDEMLNEIDMLKKSIVGLEKERTELKIQVEKLTEINEVMQTAMDQLIATGEQVKKERDIAQMHLSNAEAAFSDVHQKYENLKVQVHQFKIMDDKHRKDIACNVETLEMQTKKYDAFKSFAMGQIEKCNLECREMKLKYETDLAKLTAQMRRYEIQSRSLEQALEQKTKECEQLAAIYDEMVGKV